MSFTALYETWWNPVPEGNLPYITGTGSIDADFGFRFVFHGSDWTKNLSNQLKTAVPGVKFTVVRYVDGPNSQVLVVGNLSILLAAKDLLLATGPELAALNLLLGL